MECHLGFGNTNPRLICNRIQWMRNRSISILVAIMNDKSVSPYMKTIYFQPKGINPKFCEAGVIHESDNESIRYLSEPCKVSINDVKIIPNESVAYDEKNGLYLVRESTHSWTNRQPLFLPNLPQRQPINWPTKPQTYENNDTKRKSMAVVELLWNFIRKIW